MKASVTHSTALVAFTLVLASSCANASPLAAVGQSKPFSQSAPIEGRSLLDLLIGGSSVGNAATSVKGSTSPFPLLDLAQTLLGKGDSMNSKLYMKVLKLIFNLFMDVMADRMDEGTRREDISPLALSSLLRSKFSLNNSPVHERQVESILKRQRMYKPYIVE